MGNFNRDDRGGRKFGGRDKGNRSFDRGGSRGGFGGGRGGDRPMMHRATCADCGRACEVPFKPTGDKPVYCNDCFGGNSGPDRFDNRGRDRRSDRLSFDDKKMFSAKCDKCGENCEVPFKPNSGKPVFCDHCFKKSDSSDGSTKKSNSNFGQANQLDEINAKLDLIIRALANLPKSNQPTPTIITEKAQEKAIEKKTKAKKEIVVEEVKPKKELKAKKEKKSETKKVVKKTTKKK